MVEGKWIKLNISLGCKELVLEQVIIGCEGCGGEGGEGKSGVRSIEGWGCGNEGVEGREQDEESNDISNGRGDGDQGVEIEDEESELVVILDKSSDITRMKVYGKTIEEVGYLGYVKVRDW